MKQLFTNKIMINQKKNKVINLLMSVNDLPTWNPAIIDIRKLSDNSFAIHRNGDALNTDEVISINNEVDKIIYYSTGGRIEYQLIFELTGMSDQTLITESFYLEETSRIWMPVTILIPVAEKAFNQNLNTLKLLLDQRVNII